MYLFILLSAAGLEWTVADYDEGGTVRFENGVIYLDEAEGFTGVNYTGEFPRINYEIRLDAMRVSGEDFFCGLTFPYKDEYCTLIVGGWGGRLVGLSCIDGMDAYHNETRTYHDFQNGKWYHIRLRATQDRIQTLVDGKLLINQSTAGRRISVRPDVKPSLPLGLASFFTAAAIRNFTIEPVN